MAIWLQHLLVLLLLAGCVGYVAWQGVKTFTFRKGKLGACCAKGCPSEPAPRQSDGRRVVFMTSDMIGIIRKRS